MLRKSLAVFAIVTLVFFIASSILTASTGPLHQTPPRGTDRSKVDHWPQASETNAAAGAAEWSSPSATTGFMQWSKLVFQSYRNNNWEIYIGNTDGSGQTRLTNTSASDRYPRLNRGATRVAFASNRTGNYEIFSMNPDGSGVTQLTSAAQDDFSPSWSPDGSKIAFNSYRDGQSEIYVMNANGTNQVRLTNDAGYDGQPVWSPDSTQIAFTSDRGTPANTGARIWVMNANGTGQTQLSSQFYSENPTWSPDGTRIAYDADGNNDGWQEIWQMNANGSGQAQVYDPPEAETDAWVRSWSPNGQYIAFTRITFIYYQGNWYWLAAYLDAWDTTIGSSIRLSGQDVDWYPDWQSTDIGLPTSQVNALPAESPGPFTVSWSGSDAGPSGIQNYDVQVKDGNAGTWTDWLLNSTLTSASYPGIGGHTYYFRSRARDNADNVEPYPATTDASTTVENAPPVANIAVLPRFVRGQATIFWNGTDSGGSGIKTYDVQYRDSASGSWTDWQAAVTTTSASFAGVTGNTYAFRVRAIDRAFNQGNWSIPDENRSTTFYAWVVTGKVWDNAGYNVAGVAITTTPEYLASLPSGGTLSYTAYGATSADVYSATWSTPGYGHVPTTPFRLNAFQDAHLDVVLPPLDNVIRNGSFESGDWGSAAWQVGSSSLPVITDTAGHTGRYAAAMGCDLFKPAELIPNSPIAIDPQLALDGADTLHVVWRAPLSSENADIFYARRPQGAGWSAPVNVSNTPAGASWPQGWSDSPRLAADANGTVHLIWWEGVALGRYDIFYAQRTPAGTWSTAQNISNSSVGTADAELVVDFSGTLHVVWSEGDVVRYTRRTTNGSWSSPVTVSGATGSQVPNLVVDGAGGVHVVWGGIVGWNSDVFYAYRSPAGNWSTPRNVSNSLYQSSYAPALAVSSDGTVHLAWNEDFSLSYASRNTNGMWSSPQEIAGAIEPHMLVDSTGALHIVSGGSNSLPLGGFFYIQRGPDGSWSEPVDVGAGQATRVFPNRVTPRSTGTRLALDLNNVLHVVWERNDDVFYSRRASDGKWLDPINLSNNPGWSGTPRIVVRQAGAPTIVWSDMSSSDKVAYADLALAPQLGAASITQSVAVPITLTTPTLSFLYKYQPGLSSPISGNTFVAEVSDTAGAHSLLTHQTVADAWTHASYDLSAWAGQTITLTFRLQQVANQPCQRAHLDDVTLGSWLTPVPLAVQPSQVRTGQGAVITITGLNFIGATPGEPYAVRLGTSQLPDARWINSTTLTATVPYSLPFGLYDVFATNPGGQSGVLPGGLLIGARVYLPLIRK